MQITANTPLLNIPPGNGNGASKPSKLHEAAQQFEALMIGEMMKSVHESSTSGWLGSDGDEGGDNQAMEMAESQFANALAISGGLGLARMVEQSVNIQKNQTQPLRTEK